MHEQDTIEWQSYDFDYKEKTADWFWAVAIITLSLTTLAAIYNNPLFALFMVIAGATILMTAQKKPKVITFKLTTKGIKIDENLFTYDAIKSFWIKENRYSPPKLLVRSEKFITPVMVIPIETDVANASEVRTFLLAFVPEEKLIEPFSHKFMNFLGF